MQNCPAVCVVPSHRRGPRIGDCFGPDPQCRPQLAGTLTTRQLQIQDFQARWEKQTLQGKGEIDFSVPTTPIWLEAEAREISVPSVIEGLGLSIPIRGTSGLKISAFGPFSNPKATLEFETHSLAYSGELLGHLSSQARWHQRLLTLEKFQLEKPQAGTDWILQATGNLNLESGTYDFQVKSDPLAISSLQLPAVSPSKPDCN